MAIRSENRVLITSRQAAEELGLSMARVRQLCQCGQLWCIRPSNRMTMLDRDEVKKYAKNCEKMRSAGKMPGPCPKGFAAG